MAGKRRKQPTQNNRPRTQRDLKRKGQFRSIDRHLHALQQVNPPQPLSAIGVDDQQECLLRSYTIPVEIDGRIYIYKTSFAYDWKGNPIMSP